MIERIAYFLILSCTLLIAACDQDPFHQSYRKIGGSYYLHRWEDGKTYYIEQKADDSKQDQGGGIINGTVEKVGWNADYIIVLRKSTYGGDTNGWMFINIKTAEIRGPFDQEAIERVTAMGGIKFLEPEKAWQELR